MGLELSLSAVRANDTAPPLALSAARLPVLIGRDPGVASFALPDANVSRVHASLDVRQGRLCVRDAGSTNGTFVAGQRIPSDRWVDAGPLDRPCEILVGQWFVRITVAEAAPTTTRDGSVGAPALETMMSGDPRPATSHPSANATVVRPAAVVARAYAMMMSARNDLVTIVGEVLEAARPEERPQLVEEILKSCSAIDGDPAARAVLERYAGRPLAPTFESAAAMALQELARWYVAGRGPLRTARDAFDFARKIKAGIDELLTGLVPMFAGLDRFEQQIALGPRKDAPSPRDVPLSARLPRTPRDAARLLFDWQDRTDAGVRAMRTDLVDLTMHQVALLNGMMRGVKVLLAELSPGTLEQAWRKRVAERGPFGRLLGHLRASSEKWALHAERHSDLADEENERFRVIFGPEFVAEYKQSGQWSGSLTSPAASTILPSPPLPTPIRTPASPPAPWAAPPLHRPPVTTNRN